MSIGLWAKYGSILLWAAILIGAGALGFFIWRALGSRGNEDDVQGEPTHDTAPGAEHKSPVAAGREGEREVQYALKWLDQRYYTMHDLLLKGPGLDTQQFDHLVVSPQGVINLETKNYTGTLRIDPYGVWTQQTRAGHDPQRITSPVFQVQRHRAVLRDILHDQVPIHDFIVIANPGTMIEGREHCPVAVVTADLLLQAIQRISVERPLSDEEVSRLRDQLSAHVVKTRG